MALSRELRLAIEAKLRLGQPPKQISQELGVKLPTVYAISQSLRKSKDNDLVGEMHALPTAVIVEVLDKAKTHHSPDPEIVAAMDSVAVGAEGLKKLDGAFQATVINALKRFDLLLSDENLPLKDIIQITNTTASAYEKIFSSGTNIHIGDNNQHSTQQLTVFKNKQGV